MSVSGGQSIPTDFSFFLLFLYLFQVYAQLALDFVVITIFIVLTQWRVVKHRIMRRDAQLLIMNKWK